MTEQQGLICLIECEEYTIACEGEWEESVVCKKCGCPIISQEIIQVLNEYKTLKKATEALSVVFDEMKRQDEKWGEQRVHPPEWWYPILGEEFGELGKAMLENHFAYPDATPTNVKKELVQVIAVGIQWLRGIAYADIQDGNNG